MRKYSLAYYLLCFLLVAGAFAAMAQNDYGIKILGGVAIAFSLLFAMQFVQELRKDKVTVFSLLECGSLVIMSSILAMRAYFIRFQFVELLFGVAGFILIVVYSITLYQLRNEIRNINKILFLLVFIFYGSLIFYVLSMVLVPLMPDFAEPIGVVAFALLLSFFLFGYMKKELVAEDEKISAFRYVLKFKDRSIVLLTLFVLFTAYMGLTKVGVLPTMYSDEYPQAYFELVKQAEGGNEKPVNGKYKHEEFKEMYDAFVSRNSMSNQK